MKILLLLLSTLLNATGSPYINIKLTPIATNYDGQVLFQTYSDINTDGSYSCTHEKFGWLVVSANGIWDERVAYDTSEIFDENCNHRNEKKYNAYKTGKITLKNPDRVLAKLEDKYYFDRSASESNELFNVLELKPKQSCFLGKCIDTVLPQKSLEGFVSKELIYGKSRNLRSSFYYNGVALIRTPFYKDEETTVYDEHERDNPKSYEQKFNLPKLAKGRSYDAKFIDSIVFVEPFDFRQPTQKVKDEVEKVVVEVVNLLKESTAKSTEALNAKYIHPSYGFYLLYRIGACDSIKHYKKLDLTDLSNRQKNMLISDVFYHFYLGDEKFKLPSIQWKKTSFDCDTEKWSKKGVLVHDNSYDVTSYVCDFKTAYTQKEKKQMKFLTSDTFVVHITEYDINFELKKIDGRWYIVLINGVETDCSA